LFQLFATIATVGKFTVDVVDIDGNLPPVCTTQAVQAAIFAAGVVDTGCNFATGVVDFGGAP
jgi:hypothetical protein